MSDLKIIKRYANRKLYDTEQSSYVTLDDICMMIKAAEDVRIIDNQSGEDLTSVTLAQIIFEMEKRRNFMPLHLLRDLIENRGDALGEFAREHVDRVQAKANEFRESAGKLTKETAQTVRDLLQNTQNAFQDLQKGLEKKLKVRVGSGLKSKQLKKEMDDIAQRLSSLKKKLANFPK